MNKTAQIIIDAINDEENTLFLKSKYPNRISKWPHRYDCPDVDFHILNKGDPNEPVVGVDEMIAFMDIDEVVWDNIFEETKGTSANPWNRVYCFCAELDGWITLYECKWFDNYRVIKRQYLIGFELEEDLMAFKLRWS